MNEEVEGLELHNSASCLQCNIGYSNMESWFLLLILYYIYSSRIVEYPLYNINRFFTLCIPRSNQYDGKK